MGESETMGREVVAKHALALGLTVVPGIAGQVVDAVSFVGDPCWATAACSPTCSNRSSVSCFADDQTGRLAREADQVALVIAERLDERPAD